MAFLYGFVWNPTLDANEVDKEVVCYVSQSSWQADDIVRDRIRRSEWDPHTVWFLDERRGITSRYKNKGEGAYTDEGKESLRKFAVAWNERFLKHPDDPRYEGVGQKIFN